MLRRLLTACVPVTAQRLAAWVSGAMGLLGLVLGAVGVYGITAYTVVQRRREIGVRIALGARPGDVLSLMLRRGMVAPLVGMAVGLSISLPATHALSGLLAGVSPADPVTLGAVVAVLSLVAGVAILVPCGSASRMDPMTTLRAD